MLYFSIIFLGISLSSKANAITLEFGPAYNPDNGHWYSIYKNDSDIDITWEAAKVLAEAEGGYLATLLNHEEDRFVLDAFAGHNILKGVRGWIGLSDKGIEGDFQWVTGTEGTQPLNYNTHWLPGEPSNSEGENYVEWQNEPLGYGTDKAWNDVPDNAAGMFRLMVEFDDVPENVITLEFGPVYNPDTGSSYAIYKTVHETEISWTTAEALAESEGGYLATLLTHEEDRFVLDAFAGHNILISVRAWIGLSDKDVEGSFQWVTGSRRTQPLSYSHWLQGEPSNSEGEDYVEWKNEPLGYGTNEAWNDLSDNAAGMFRFMVEFGPPKHFYVIPGPNGKRAIICL